MRTVFLICDARPSEFAKDFGLYNKKGRVTYLTTIGRPMGKLLDLLGSYCTLPLPLRCVVGALDECLPDTGAGFLVQIIVLDAEMYSRLDGIIEDCDAVGGKDHDALEVFQLPEEDRDQGVVMQVVERPAFNEDISFIK